TARMSAVVSVMMTRTTTTIEMMAPAENVGAPKASGVGSATIPASVMPEKSTLPNGTATTVPRTIPSRIDIREIVAIPTLESTTTMTSVINASTILLGAPKSSLPTPPMAHSAATDISDRPITVMIVPVTTGGKNFTTLAKNGAMIRPMTE